MSQRNGAQVTSEIRSILPVGFRPFHINTPSPVCAVLVIIYADIKTHYHTLRRRNAQIRPWDVYFHRISAGNYGIIRGSITGITGLFHYYTFAITDTELVIIRSVCCGFIIIDIKIKFNRIIVVPRCTGIIIKRVVCNLNAKSESVIIITDLITR